MGPESVIARPYLCDAVFSRLLVWLSESLVTTCTVKSTYAEVLDHKDVYMANGISFGIVLGVMVEMAANDQHLFCLQKLWSCRGKGG